MTRIAAGDWGRRRSERLIAAQHPHAAGNLTAGGCERLRASDWAESRSRENLSMRKAVTIDGNPFVHTYYAKDSRQLTQDSDR